MPNISDIIGQHTVKDKLIEAIISKKVAHAYIFAGEEGMGRQMLAKAWAKILLCEVGDTDACGQCHSCIQIEADTNPDMIVVSHDKKSSISIEDVRRQIEENISIKPFAGRYKIYIVPDAQLMTQEAQNALLKTIEEPPEYAIIILITTSRFALLETIRSRCVNMEFEPVSDREIVSLLVDRYKISQSDAKLYVVYASGNIEKAIKAATDSDIRDRYDEDMDFISDIRNKSILEISEKASQIASTDADAFINLCRIWYRDIASYMIDNDDNIKPICIDRKEDIQKLATNMQYDHIGRIIDAIDMAQDRMRYNVNKEAAIENMLIMMKEN